MSMLRALQVLGDVRRDPSGGRQTTWRVADAENAMRREGLDAELGELRRLMQVLPTDLDLPMYEFYRWGYDEWRPSPDDVRAFVETCRRLTGGSTAA